MAKTVRELMVEWQENMNHGASTFVANRFLASQIIEIMKVTDEMEELVEEWR